MKPSKHVPKWIILEGWDKTGKSTLAEYIAKKTGRPHIWVGPPSGRRCDRELIRLIESNYHTGAVLDRAWWSNVVYAALVPHRDVIRTTSLIWLELATADGVLIRTTCSDPELHRERMRLESPNDQYAHLLDPEVGNLRFEAAMAGSRMPAHRQLEYDSATTTPKEMLERIIEGNNPVFDPKVCWGLGGMYPQLTLVGDRNPRGGMPWASVASGVYLMHCLSHLQWNTRQLYLTNSVSPTLWEELMASSFGKIVALGIEAQKRLEKLDPAPEFDFITLNHPQYQRRFRSADRFAYVRQLKEISGFDWYRGPFVGSM